MEMVSFFITIKKMWISCVVYSSYYYTLMPYLNTHIFSKLVGKNHIIQHIYKLTIRFTKETVHSFINSFLKSPSLNYSITQLDLNNMLHFGNHLKNFINHEMKISPSRLMGLSQTMDTPLLQLHAWLHGRRDGTAIRAFGIVSSKCLAWLIVRSASSYLALAFQCKKTTTELCKWSDIF